MFDVAQKSAAPKVTLLDTFLSRKGQILVKGGDAPFIALGAAIEEAKRNRGLTIAGLVTGYPGSPVADVFSIGRNLARSGKGLLQKLGIKFVRAPTEIDAVGVIRGSQNIGMPRTDGLKDDADAVFGIAAMKAPGLLQVGDHLSQANYDGVNPNGGGVIIVGDDPAGSSTAILARSDKFFDAVKVPVLTPSSIDQYTKFIALGGMFSRLAGSWVGVAVTPDVAEDWKTINADEIYDLNSYEHIGEILKAVAEEFKDDLVRIGIDPTKPNFLNFDTMYSRHQQGALQDIRLKVVEKLVDAYEINSIPKGYEAKKKPKIGIVASGASYAHLRQAFYDLGITQEKAEELGIRLLEVGAPNSISKKLAADFAEGLSEILVVEELHNSLEQRMRDLLYDAPSKPRIVGRKKPDGSLLLEGIAHNPNMVALAVANRVLDCTNDAEVRQKRDRIVQSIRKDPSVVKRLPDLCPGCPHAISTVAVPGSYQLAPTSCAVLRTKGFTPNPSVAERYAPMRGEILAAGEGPFSATEHFFQLMGDGTFDHSGSATIASAVKLYRDGLEHNVTYEILYNGTIAMTGGQDHHLSIKDIVEKVRADKVQEIVIATKGDRKYRRALRKALAAKLPRTYRLNWTKALAQAKRKNWRHAYYEIAARKGMPRIVEHDRENVEQAKLSLQEVAGVSVLIADKECATERRRFWARNKSAKPQRRPFINQEVCEACGNCSDISGQCAGINFVNTTLGPKSFINPTICNIDMSCLKGFCPAFVTVHGEPRTFSPYEIVAQKGYKLLDLEVPKQPNLGDHYSVLAPGIGGQGAVYVGSLLSWASQIQNQNTGSEFISVGHGAAGLAQKGGEVTSYVKIGTAESQGMHSSRISAGQASLVLACDAVNAADPKMLETIGPNTFVVVNTGIDPVIQAKHNPAARFKDREILQRIEDATAKGNFLPINASGISKAVTGSELAANVVMLGYAVQKGLIPLNHDSIAEAIRLSGTALEANLSAFEWGRRCAQQPDIAAALTNAAVVQRPVAQTLEEKIEARAKLLEQYRDAAYAQSYRDIVKQVRAKTKTIFRTNLLDAHKLDTAVAENLFLLMYQKDEFEVARLYLDKGWRDTLAQQFGNNTGVTYHFGPELWGKFRAVVGKVVPLPEKLPVHERLANPMFRALDRMKWMRDKQYNPFNFFGHSAERRLNQTMRVDYDKLITRILAGAANDNWEDVLKEAQRPSTVRGYGRVLLANARKAGYTV